MSGWDYPVSVVTTPGGFELQGTEYPQTGCSSWSVPGRAFSIGYYTYEQVTSKNRHGVPSNVKGYNVRPRYIVYQDSMKKGDCEFKTINQALTFIDSLLRI